MILFFDFLDFSIYHFRRPNKVEIGLCDLCYWHLLRFEWVAPPHFRDLNKEVWKLLMQLIQFSFIFIRLTKPLYAAVINADHPSLFLKSISLSALFLNSKYTILSWPGMIGNTMCINEIFENFWEWFCRNYWPTSAAMYNGVRFRLSRLLTWAPFRMSRSTIFSWPVSIRKILNLEFVTLHINRIPCSYLWRQLLALVSSRPDFFHSHSLCFESTTRLTVNFLYKSIQLISLDIFSRSSHDSPSKIARCSANFDLSLFEIIQYYFLFLFYSES